MPNKNIRGLSSRKGLQKNLFDRIGSLAEENASEEKFKELAASFMIDDSVVAGTSSFYDFTREEERTRKIRICNGTACMVANKQSTLKGWLDQEFSQEEIGEVACVGRCHSNNAVLYQKKTYSIESPDFLKKLVHEGSELEQENEYAVEANCTPILTGPIDDIKVFFSLANRVIENPASAISQFKDSKLRGRGGAGFPFWFKLEAVYKEENPVKYVVCNADEGDPGAYSDMYLMEHQPFKVLFGMYVSGLICGAKAGVLYIRGEYPDSIRIVQEAIDQLEELGLIGEFEFKIIKGQGSYVCGEETALLSSIEGLRPEVRVRPPYPAQYGLYGKPTLLSNVETFANIHWILENGGKAYASLGTESSSGTKLVSLDSFFNRPGMYEIEMGTSLKTVFDDYGKGLKDNIKAFQIGGPLGGIVPAHKVKDLSLDFESFDQGGFLLGHASVVSIPEDFPMIQFLEHLLHFTADESCGKCYPCRIGSHRGYEMLQKARLEDDFKIDPVLLDDLIETLEIGSLCALGGGVPLPMKNALHYFKDELATFFED